MDQPLMESSFIWMRIFSLLPILLFTLLIIGLIFILMKKSTSEVWKNFSPNLKAFYLYVAAFVGLVLTLVNGVTLGQTFLASEVFGMEYSYIDSWTCENKFDADGAPLVMTDEENQACMDKARERAIENYQLETTRAYASGIAGLFFGLIVWVPHFILARRVK